MVVTQMRRRRAGMVLAVLAVALQCAALYLPGRPDSPSVIPHLDKAVHVALFAGPVYLWLRLGVRRRLVVPAAMAQVVISEVVQARLIPHRMGDVGDAVADALGIGIGVWLARLRLREGFDRSRQRAG